MQSHSISVKVVLVKTFPGVIVVVTVLLIYDLLESAGVNNHSRS